LSWTLESFVEEFGDWARLQPDIEGVALVGSYARQAATEESDVDLIILTWEREKYFQNHEWLSRFGQIEETEYENWGRVKSLRAFYEGNVEIEYSFSTPDWADIPIEMGTYRVVSAGMRIIFDPQNRFSALQQGISGDV
jgi:predicted nucleotidyltransferase